MIISQLRQILNSFPASYDNIEVASNVDLSGFSNTACVIIDQKSRFRNDYSWVEKPIMFLNEFSKVMTGYEPEIYLPK